MPSVDPVNCETLDATVARLRLGVSASELHGLLSGYLAGGAVLDERNVLGALELDGEAVAAGADDLGLFARLARESVAGLADAELGFEPLLPADDRPLAERAEALVAWCRGFLGGLGLGGADAHAGLSDDAHEVLRDLGAIAASSFDYGNEDEDEDALVEVQEFVRMAALMLFAECAARQLPGSRRVH